MEDTKDLDSRRICPPMVIDRTIGQQLEDYLSVKYPFFIQNNLFTPIFISKETFHDILDFIRNSDNSINGFRIYLGFDGNKIKFIFCGLRGVSDIEVYYLLLESGRFKSKTKDEADTLVKNYLNVIYPQTQNVVHNNTKSYVYNGGLINSFLDELDFQQSNIDIIGVKIKLGAFINNLTNPDPQNYPDYTNRIMIGFTFIKSDNTEIGLNEISDNYYGCNITNGKSEFIGADTGSPCPPGPGCGISSLPKSST